MQELYKRLRDFKLSGMALTLEDRLSYARSKKLPYEEFLELLCEDELDNRRDNNYKRRYSAAKLPARSWKILILTFRKVLMREKLMMQLAVSLSGTNII
ncbi:MAG: hypothetical protein J0M23_07040 [Rickettsiales bacterium]|nr:hypothetical protein [Rickettsiales bacterium]